MRWICALCWIVGCGENTSTIAPIPATAQAAPVQTHRDSTSAIELVGPRAAARHILIAYEGANGATEVDRSKSDALALAAALRVRLLAGEDFSDLAKAHSDDGTGRRGGDLGVFAKGVMAAPFEAFVFNAEIGQLSDVVETPFGFHLIERRVVEEIHVAHVLVQWQGLFRATTERTREQAELRAAEALAALHEGEGFMAVAKSFSDGPTGTRGGDLGWFQRGQMVPAFDDAAFALDKGETTAVIESPLGLHIIYRVE
jgi:parvulin-like peptidyl-prolyl isomerase